MFLEGALSKIILKVSPKIYQKYVIMSKKGKPFLYVQIQKALYGLLHSALLFYRKLVMDIEAYGFQINPYDPFVKNKMINHKLMRVVWNVDYLKVAHVNSFEITKFAGYQPIIYGGLIVHRGKVHEYLVMDLYYRKQVTVKSSMIKYLYSVLQEFPENLGKNSATSVADHFFTVHNEGETWYLSEE